MKEITEISVASLIIGVVVGVFATIIIFSFLLYKETKKPQRGIIIEK